MGGEPGNEANVHDVLISVVVQNPTLPPLTDALHAGHVKGAFHSGKNQIAFCYPPHS